MRLNRVAAFVLATAAYAVVGAGTAVLAGMAASSGGVKVWRATAWLLSLVVFLLHFASERRRQSRPLNAATCVAFAVGLGALCVAALGPLRAHWADAARLRLVLLSIVAWPLLAGIPAFVVALLGGFLLDSRGSTSRSASRGA